MYRVCITKIPREIWQRLTEFWIKENDILRLFECMQLSDSTASYQKNRCDRFVALCILLKRISYPCRCKDMVPLFGWNLTELCLIFTLDFIYHRHHHRLESWNLFLFTTAIFTETCRCSSWKCTSLKNCFGFVDETVACVCRLLLNEKVVHSDRARVHGFAKWLDYQPLRAMGRPKTWLYAMLYELGLLN